MGEDLLDELNVEKYQQKSLTVTDKRRTLHIDVTANTLEQLIKLGETII